MLNSSVIIKSYLRSSFKVGEARLDQCIDSATGLTEIYTWNADTTLASMPGSGYTREFTYNEEAQLLGISHSGTLAYEYAYGADGNRRWSKDYTLDKWTWYPCGVACGAGEMVEETSTLAGTSWSVSSQYLRAGGGCSSMLIRQKITNMNDEYHHSDIVGMYPVLTDASANVLRSYVFDAYAVPQSQLQFVGESYPSQSNHTGTCSTAMSEPGMQSSPSGGAVSFQARALNTTSKKSKKAKPCHSSGVSRASECQTGYHHCKDLANSAYIGCVGALTAGGAFFGGWIGGTWMGYAGAGLGGLVGAGVGTVDEPGGGTVLGGIAGSWIGGMEGVLKGVGIGAAVGGALGGGAGAAACSRIHNKTLSKCYINYWGCINNPGTPVTKWFPA